MTYYPYSGYGFTIRARDARGCYVDRRYFLACQDIADFELSDLSPNNPCPRLTFGGTTPAGTLCTLYATQLSTTGGVAPYTYRLASGELPPGLYLTSNGSILGIPSQTGTFPFSVLVTDRNGCPDRKSFSITVSCSLASWSFSLPESTVGDSFIGYVESIDSCGAASIYAIVSGSLPPGLSLNLNGTVTGTLAPNGSADKIFDFVVESTSPEGCKSQQAFSIRVLDPVPPSCPLSASGTYKVTDGPILFASHTDTCDAGHEGLTADATVEGPWDGTLAEAGSCLFVAPISSPFNWLGKRGQSPIPSIQLFGTNFWELAINMNRAGGGDALAIYRKPYGKDAAGIFTAVCPSAVPQTLLVEKV